MDEGDTFDAKVYRINIDLYPKIQAENEVVILPTIIFYDDGEEVERLQGDMSFSLKTTIKELAEIKEERLSRKKYDGGPLASMIKILDYTDTLDYLVIAHTQPLDQAGTIDLSLIHI